MVFLLLLFATLCSAALGVAGYYLPDSELAAALPTPFVTALVGTGLGLWLSLIASGVVLHRQRRQQLASDGENRHLQLLLEHGQTAVVLLNRELQFCYCNQRFVEMLDLDPRQTAPDLDVERWRKHLPEKTVERINRAIDQGKTWKGELRLPTTTEDLHLSVSIAPLPAQAEGPWQQLLLSCEDISELKAIGDRLFIQEHYSVQTGLPNRQLALKKLAGSIASCRDSGEGFVLAHVDMDRIRYINDSLGHVVVDSLLNDIAERLRNSVKDDQVLAHLGADEFLLLLNDGSTLDEAAMLAEAMLDNIRQPFFIDNNEINLTASIGLSKYPDDGADAIALMQGAEAAMYAAKEEGGNRFCFYDETMGDRSELRMETENQLRHAIERKEFSLHYQPVINLNDNQLVGVEVLLRWRNEELRNPGPDNFIRVAEDSGLIVTIGDWVLQKACKQAVKWSKQGLPPLRLAVNISARQFREGEVVHSVERALQLSGLPASQLELEITEGLLINDAPHIRRCFSQLKALGVRLSIDDFGTGYASLSYLKRYPFDTLKIDRGFIHDLDTSEDSITLTTAIVAMAHSFNMEVVAEGVENLQQRRILKERQCDMVQGFLYSPPIAADHFAAWAKRYHDIQYAQYV